MMVTDILIEPVGKEFDIGEVEAYLTAQPHTARDAFSQDKFMIAPNDEELEDAREARRRDSKRFPMSVILVDITATRIDISYRTAHVDPARRFVEWLRARYVVRYTDEEFNDLTNYCRENLDYLFGSRSDDDGVESSR